MHHCNHAIERSVTGKARALRRAVLRGSIPVLLGLSAACAHGQAKTIAELPPLQMPEPPPRVVEPAEPQPTPVVALPDEPRINLPPRPATPQRTDTPRPEPPKTDSAAPANADQARPPEDNPRPNAPTLQTTPTQREGEVERRVRILIAQAMNDLNRVNYQALNADARNQYDTAKRFAIQAEEAVRARNLVFASNLADKAAALAAQLLGR
jgi:hypothetical protein